MEVDVDVLFRKISLAILLIAGELVECLVPLCVTLMELSCTVLSDNHQRWLLFRGTDNSSFKWDSLYWKSINTPHAADCWLRLCS